ncbi:MAG: glycosyltransferase [Anaerolineae bacterium]|nr:glycosyltransferase [Anaerolineae bacterium]
MQIVFISWWWPYPASNGAKIRIYNLVRHLASRHQVTLLSFAEADEATAEQVAHLRAFCARVEVVRKPMYNPGAVKALMGYLSSWPRSLVDVYSEEMDALVRRVAAETPIDVLIASEFQTMRYLELLPDVPVILEEFEITSFHDAVRRSAGTTAALRTQMTLSKMQNAVRRLVNQGAAVTVVSETEAEYVRRAAGADAMVRVVPNGVDTTVHQPNSRIQPQAQTLIYSGAVTYSANYDAVAYFIREVWPLVRARYPEARFTVTGGTGSVDVSDLAVVPGVTFSGYLPSVAEVVQGQWAVVTPLREGGGTRLKILEAMALGTPVVSTSKGAEGLAVVAGEHLLVADDAEGLAAAISRLFEDEGLRQRLANNGRALVAREYDWNVIAGRLLELVELMGSRTVKDSTAKPASI